jgi:hypothetical protein
MNVIVIDRFLILLITSLITVNIFRENSSENTKSEMRNYEMKRDLLKRHSITPIALAKAT